MINIQGVMYNYETVGEGEPLLLLHGFTGSMETWRSFLPSWSKYYRIILVDLLGHGNTQSPEDEERYNITYAARDLLKLLDFLHIDKVHILGYSMGGRVAVTFACLYPDRVHSLLLESCTAGLETAEEREERVCKDRKLADFIETEGVPAFVERWESIPLFESQQHLPMNVKEMIRRERMGNHSLGLANSLRGMGTGMQPSWWKHLHQLSIPVLLLCGEYDKKFIRILSRMKEILPNATFIQIAKAGHAIHVEQPKKFDTIVKGFLKKLDE